MNQRFPFILVCSVLFVFISGCKTGETPGAKVKRYPHERIHIQYEVSGGIRGREEIFIADYGRLDVRYSDLEILRPIGIERDRTISLTRGADLYKIDIDDGAGIHIVVPELDSLYKGLLPERTPQELSDIALRRGGLQKEGTDSVFGFQCDKWVSSDGMMTIWISNGMMLRKKSPDRDGGTMDEIAIMVDTNWVVDTTVFAVPSGIKLKEKVFGTE